MLPFPRPLRGCRRLPLTYFTTQHTDVILSLPFWAVSFLLVPRGSPQGCMGRHIGYSWPFKGGRWKGWKKRKSHTQMDTNFYSSVLIDPHCFLFWTQSDGLWSSHTLMRSWVQAKNTANACAVVPCRTPQLGGSGPKMYSSLWTGHCSAQLHGRKTHRA